MPHFFFHIHDGVSSRDAEGTELPSWHEAQTEAIRLAGAVIADKPSSLKLGEDWLLEVTDEVGLVLFRISFQITAEPQSRI